MKKIFVFIFALMPLVAAAQSSAAPDLVLKNKHVELTFDGGKNFLFKTYRRVGAEGIRGVNMLPGTGSATHPWVITFRGPNGETPSLQSRYGFYDGGVHTTTVGGGKLVFTWRVLLGAGEPSPVRMTVTLGAESELPEWTLEADLPEGWLVNETEFPRIAVPRPDGAKGILPVGYGTEYTIGTSGQLQSRYPSGTGTMQLVMMHHEGGTVYFAAKDMGGSNKILRMLSEGGNVVFVQQVTASWGWTENGRFILPWANVLGFNPEGWQATALKWYRPFSFETPWGGKTLGQRPIAEWMKRADMWIRPDRATPDMMEWVRKAMKYYGKGVGVHWYSWQQYPHDVKYPEYFPEQSGFKEMITETQKLGGYITPYTNARLWDPATESYTTLKGAEASCRRTDGTLYTEVYSSRVVNTVTCPASPIWQGIVTDINHRLLDELKVDGVYMDQIGAASSEPCYATNHGHAPGAGEWWPAAYRSLLERMRADFYKDDNAMTTEENAECYIDLFDMMLIVNSPHNAWTRMVPLFPLIYADRCIYSGYTYIPWKLNDGSMNFITMKSLLWGSQLGWVNPELLMNPVNEKEAAFLKTLAAFRKGQHDLFVGGRFMGEFVPTGDNPTQVIPNYETTPVVLAAEWESVSGKRAWVVVNMSDTARAVTLPDGKSLTIAAMNATRVAK
jgi:hypothetical protein